MYFSLIKYMYKKKFKKITDEYETFDFSIVLLLLIISQLKNSYIGNFR